MPSVLNVSNNPNWGYSYVDELPVAVLSDGGPYDTARRQLAAISRRRYSLPLACINSERLTADAFLVQGRAIQKETFYFKDPQDSGRTGVSLGTGTGSQTVFPLPAAGENLRDYPINDSTLVLKVNGTPVSATAQTDARTITAAAAPGAGTTVTADYTYYRLVRLDDGFEWTVTFTDWNTAQIELVEALGE